jgi:hypothetical protein
MTKNLLKMQDDRPYLSHKLWQNNCNPVGMKQLFLLFCVTVLAAACATNRDTAKEVKKETAQQRKSPLVLAARSGDQSFNLRQFNFFDYTEGGQLYAGTYSMKGDSVMLGFHNNFKPEDLIGKGLVDRQDGTVILFSKDGNRHRRLAIAP